MKIEGVPNSDTQITSEMTTTRMSALRVQPKYLIKVIPISILPNPRESIYIVNQVRVINQNGRIGKVLYK